MPEDNKTVTPDSVGDLGELFGLEEIQPSHSPAELSKLKAKRRAELERSLPCPGPTVGDAKPLDADYYDAAPFSQVLAESKAKKSDADPLAELRPKLKAIERAALADMRREEAGRALSWLNANGCLVFGALPKALAAIEKGEHRR